MRRPLPPPARYGAALGFAAVGLLVVGLLGTDTSPLFLTVLPAVLASALLLGFAEALVCTLALALAGSYFFVEPKNSLDIPSSADSVRVSMFLLSSLLTALVTTRLQRSERAAREARALLETYVDRAPIGLGFYNADLECTHANAALTSLQEGPVGDRLMGALHRALVTRQASLDETIEAQGHVFRASFYPVLTPEGELVGVGASVEDVSERTRADEGLHLLAETGALLESPLAPRERLELLARLLVPRYADECVIKTRGPLGLETSAVAHRDSAVEAELRRPGTTFGLAQVARNGQTEWTGERIAVPLMARGRVLGALHVRRDDADASVTPFDQTDVALVEELAARAALAVDTVRLLEQQTRIAHTLQESLLPPHLPDIPGVELAGRYRAGAEGSEVGGDFYDAFGTQAGWMISIGDVCGKGAEAATITALGRHTIRALAHEIASPASVLHGVNERLSAASGSPAHMTAALVRVAPVDGRLELTSAAAGHPLPVIVRADGRVEDLGRPGTLLGPFAGEAQFTDSSAVLGPGDALVLYTDGVTEARREGRLFGEERLHEAVASAAGSDAHAIADALETAVVRYGGRPDDDMAIVVLGVVGARAQVEAADFFDQ